VDNRWPVHILQHPTETKHAIGTARIVALSLTQCNLQVGESLAELSLPAELATDQSPLLVYPGEDSMPLDRLDKKITRPLIFLDASWRKSRRMLFESAELRAIPKVSFQPANVSRYRIRKEPDSHALSTLEAIAQGEDRILLTLATGTGKMAIAFQIVWKLFYTRWNLTVKNQYQKRSVLL